MVGSFRPIRDSRCNGWFASFLEQRDIAANSYGVSYSYSASRYSYSYSTESSTTVAVRSAMVEDRFTQYCSIEYEYRCTEYEYEYDLFER